MDTSVDFVNTKKGGPEDEPPRVKRQIHLRHPPHPNRIFPYGRTGYWYWMNHNMNKPKGETCFAALPGDKVRFRGFSCSDLLRY